VVYCSTLQESIERLLREVRPGDAVLAIGAGNVNRALSEFALLLGSQHFMPSRQGS
jgi:UDP-N-acetylmuramate-alanine ligase